MDILEQAKRRIAALDAEINTLVQQRASIQQWLNDGKRLLDSSQSANHVGSAQVVQIAPQPDGKRANSFKARLIRGVKEILVEKSPVPTREMIPLLEAKGLEINGSNKVLAISQVLSRVKEEFASSPDGWTLKK